MDEIAYLKVTLELMNEFGIPVRDTFNFATEHVANGDAGSESPFRIEWSASAEMAHVTAKKHHVPGHVSIAYDRYRIIIPTRFRDVGRDDPVVHECVHFLQHTTVAEDSAYIPLADESRLSYLSYLSQRVEREAHLVQVAYIAKHCPKYMASVLSADAIAEVDRLLAACGKGAPLDPALRLLTFCKNNKLI